MQAHAAATAPLCLLGRSGVRVPGCKMLQNAAVVFSAHNFFLDILALKVAGGKAEDEFHVELLKGHLAHILHLGNLQSQQQHVQHVSARIKRIGAYSLPSSQTHGPQNIAVPWAPSHTAF